MIQHTLFYSTSAERDHWSRSSPSLDPTTLLAKRLWRFCSQHFFHTLAWWNATNIIPLCNLNQITTCRSTYSKARSPTKLLHHPDMLGWLYFLSLNNSRAQYVPKSFLKRTCPYTGDPLNQKHQECWVKKREQTKTMWPNICVTLIEQDGLFKQKSPIMWKHDMLIRHPFGSSFLSHWKGGMKPLASCAVRKPPKWLELFTE